MGKFLLPTSSVVYLYFFIFQPNRKEFHLLFISVVSLIIDFLNLFFNKSLIFLLECTPFSYWIMNALYILNQLKLCVTNCKIFSLMYCLSLHFISGRFVCACEYEWIQKIFIQLYLSVFSFVELYTFLKDQVFRN